MQIEDELELIALFKKRIRLCFALEDGVIDYPTYEAKVREVEIEMRDLLNRGV